MIVDFTALPEPLIATANALAKKIKFETINDKGANGYVLMGRNILIDRKIVVKFYYWGHGAHAEPNLLSELASEHVLRVHDAAAIDESWAYFETPFCEEGDLDDVIGKGGLGIKRVTDILLEIASGVSFIHGKGFLHRDLKPSNIFCESDGRFVIGDFGSVVKKGAHGYVETLSQHSLLHRTPEEINNNRAYESGDIYQLGIILYQLLGGSLPYETQKWLTAKELEKCDVLLYPENEIFCNGIIQQKIISGKLLNFASLPPWCPRELVSIIRKCCKVDHAARLESASELISRLHNLRASLPDWRFEPDPVLYQKKNKIRIVKLKDKDYMIEKAGLSGGVWRKVHAVAPCSLGEAVKAAQAL